MNAQKCFVALVDLLGISAIVGAGELERSTAMIKRFQRITRSIVADLNSRRAVHGLDRDRSARTRMFSDLVLVQTEGDSHDDCMDILEFSSKLFRLGCEHGLLPRGAISWGDMVHSTTVTVGRPLVEAHRLEGEQDWAGIVLCYSMLHWDREEGLTGDRQASILGVAEECGWLVRWPVPVKSNPPTNRLAVNWLKFDNAPFWHKKFVDDVESEPDLGARNKLKYTQAFYEHLVQLAEG